MLLEMMTAAINAVPVVQGPTQPGPTSLFGIPWLTLPGATGVGTLAVLVSIVLRWGLPWKKQIDEVQAKVRAEEIGAVAAIQARMDGVEHRLLLSENRAHTLEIKFTVALGAYRIVASELQRLSPDSAALMQAQALLSAAYPIPAEMPGDIAETLRKQAP